MSAGSPSRLHDYTWTWVGGRLVGVPLGVDPSRLVVREVTPEQLAEYFGIERTEEGDDRHPGEAG